MRNRVFFPQGALDAWASLDLVDVVGDEAVLVASRRHYRLVEAVRVVREVTGTPDEYELVGTVRSRAFLGELEAAIVGDSMVVGDNAYEVAQGFLGTPTTPFDVHAAAVGGARAATDEELLTLDLLGRR